MQPMEGSAKFGSETAEAAFFSVPVRRRAWVSSFLGWMFDGYETSTLILVGFSAMASLLHGASQADIQLAVGKAMSSTLLGWAIGGMIGSILADYVGRKRMLTVAIAGYSLFTGLTALSTSAEALIALRFVTGLFLGSEWSTGTALVAETWPTSKRAKALGMMQSGYGFGFLLASVTWLATLPLLAGSAWRWMFAVGVLPALILLMVRRSMPESDVWRKSRDARVNRAKQLTPRRFRAIENFTVFMMLSDRASRRNVFCTLLMTTITVAVFYGTSTLLYPLVSSIALRHGLDAQKWSTVAAVVFNVGALAGYISAGFIAEALGRKRYMALTFLGGLFATPLAFAWGHSLPAVMIASVVLGFFTLGSFSWLPIYLPELFQTSIRATASGLVFNFGRLLAFPIPFYAASMMAAHGDPTLAACLIALLLILSLAVLCVLPETKGKGLPE